MVVLDKISGDKDDDLVVPSDYDKFFNDPLVVASLRPDVNRKEEKNR